MPMISVQSTTAPALGVVTPTESPTVPSADAYSKQAAPGSTPAAMSTPTPTT
jgi:hypothetical protein